MGNENNSSSFDNNDVCHYQVVALGVSETRTIQCDNIISGRYVIIQIQAVEVLTLCEVQVYECESLLVILCSIS